MKRSFFILFLSLSSFVYSQITPAYKGKRFILSARLGASFLSFNSIAGVSDKSYKIKNIAGASADFVVSRNKSLSAIYENFTIKMPYPNTINYDYASLNIPAILNAQKIGLGIKLYRRGYIAPVGKYVKIEAQFITSKIDYEKFILYQTNYYERSTSLGVQSIRYNTFSLNYTIGRTRILFNTLVLDYGLRLGVTPYILTTLGDLFEYSNQNFNIDYNYFEYYGKQRIFVQQIINIHLNIGFLAF
jgi:hypothetical protein